MRRMLSTSDKCDIIQVNFPPLLFCRARSKQDEGNFVAINILIRAPHHRPQEKFMVLRFYGYKKLNSI